MTAQVRMPVIRTDYQGSTAHWPGGTSAAGRKNLIVIVLDDVGFAQLGCYGSSISTPAIDRLAASGVRYNNFHTTALCSPTRAALLTGRNHHSNHIGAVAELATGFPGYDMRMPRENGTLAEVLREEGYATFAVGKWHLTPAEEGSQAASKERWPLGKGFDRFYGFLGAETNQYRPELVYDNHFVEQEKHADEGYHLSEDLAERSIEFIGDRFNVAPDEPYFLYLAFGACHVPHQAPKEFIDKYRGQFDMGWDQWREDVYHRQLAEGTLPPGTQLSERPDWVPAWESLSEEEKLIAARLMEAFAGFLEHTDAQIGRVLEFLNRTGTFDDTIIMVMSDNGASPEGGRQGTFNNSRYLNGVGEPQKELLANLGDLGSPRSYNHYPYGWAWAGNTPFKRWKQEAHEGGVNCPLVVHWPGTVEDSGAVRNFYTHAVDVMPTVLEGCGIGLPSTIRYVPQAPVHGQSFYASVGDGAVEPGPRIQYYEVRGCRAIYADGWKAVAYHPRVGLAWDGSDPSRPYSQDTWELYDLRSDFSECNDLSSQHPERLRDMIDLWWAEAGRYNVLPLDNRGVARIGLPKPKLGGARDVYVFYPSRAGIREHATVALKNRTHSVRATIGSLDGEEGAILAQGSTAAGFCLYMAEGELRYHYNYVGLEKFNLSTSLPAWARTALGGVEIGLDFVVDDDGDGATATLLLNGEPLAEGHIPHVVPNTLGTGGDSLYIGRDLGGIVATDAQGSFPFTGSLDRVSVRAGEAVEEDLEALLRVAAARE